MYQAPIAPQPIGGVLDGGFSLFRVAIAPVFVLAVAGALVSAPFNRAVQSIVANQPGLTGYVIVMLLVVGVLAVTTIFTGAVVSAIDRVAGGGRQSIPDALIVGLKRMPALLVSGVVYFLAVFVGMFLLIVPGIFVGIALLFFYMAVVVDDKGPIEALQYSWQLVRGNWWRTAALVLIILIVLLLLYFLLGIVAGIVIVLGTDYSIEAGESPWFVDYIVSPLIVGVVGPLGYALFMSVYRDLKLRHGVAGE